MEAERELCEERNDVAGLVKQLATAAQNLATQIEAERTLEKTCAAIVAVSNKSREYADAFIDAGGYGVVERFVLQPGLRETAATAAVLNMLSEVTRLAFDDPNKDVAGRPGMTRHGRDVKAGFVPKHGGAAASAIAALLSAAHTHGWALDGDFTGTRGNCARLALLACSAMTYGWAQARAVPGLAEWCAQVVWQCFSTNSGHAFNESAALHALKCIQNSLWYEQAGSHATTEVNARKYEELRTFQVVEAILRDARSSRGILAAAIVRDPG